jgi:hypothetical protein
LFEKQLVFLSDSVTSLTGTGSDAVPFKLKADNPVSSGSDPFEYFLFFCLFQRYSVFKYDGTRATGAVPTEIDYCRILIRLNCRA